MNTGTIAERLPAAHSNSYDWQRHGVCRVPEGTAIMFGPDGEHYRDKRMRLQRAKALCQPCPVRRNCLDHALTVGEPYGVWGGLDASERRREPWRAA